MKSPALSFLATLLTLFPQFSLADENKERITEIQGWFQATESAELRSQTFKFASDDYSDGTCTRYYQGDDLLKVTLSYAPIGGHTFLYEAYYYHQNEPYFIYVTDNSWVFGGKPNAEGEPGTIDTLTEHRIYYDSKGSIIRHLERYVASDKHPDLKKAIAAAPNLPADASADHYANYLTRVAQGLEKIKQAAPLLKHLDASATEE